MAMRDSEKSYGWTSIALHWAGAVFVIAMFLIGEQMEDLRGPERREILMLHISIGLIALPLLFVRVFWRFGNGKPKPMTSHPVLDRVAALVLYLMLVAILVAIISGPLAQWSSGRPLGFFGLFEIPSPIGQVAWLEDAMEEVHDFAAHALIPLFALHILGVVKHLVIDRDGTFARMIRPHRA